MYPQSLSERASIGLYHKLDVLYVQCTYFQCWVHAVKLTTYCVKHEKRQAAKRQPNKCDFIVAGAYPTALCRQLGTISGNCDVQKSGANVLFYLPLPEFIFHRCSLTCLFFFFFLSLSLFYSPILPFIKWPSQSFLHRQGHKNLIQLLTQSHPCDTFFT